MDMARFFITRNGLIAALSNPRVLKDVTALISGDAPKATEKDYLQKGYVAPDRRTAPAIDENLRVLGDALSRIEQVTKAATRQRPEPDDEASGEDEDEELRDLRRTPRKLYRLSAKADLVTSADLRALPAGARRVFGVLRTQDVGTTKTLTEASGLNRRTVENALSSLRKAGLLDDVDFKR